MEFEITDEVLDDALNRLDGSSLSLKVLHRAYTKYRLGYRLD